MRVLALLQTTAFEAVWDRVSNLLANAARGGLDLGIALVIGLVGWLLARLLARITLLLLRAVRFNHAMRSLGGAGGPERFEPAALASWGVYWAVLLLTVMVASDILGLNFTASLGDRLRDILPRVMAATIVLVVGVLVSMGFGAITRRVFETAGATRSRLRGQAVTATLSAFAVLLALEQLGLAAQFILALGVAAIASIGLGAALAFGLGCRDLARDFIVEYLRSAEDDSPRRPA